MTRDFFLFIAYGVAVHVWLFYVPWFLVAARVSVLLGVWP